MMENPYKSKTDPLRLIGKTWNTMTAVEREDAYFLQRDNIICFSNLLMKHQGFLLRLLKIVEEQPECFSSKAFSELMAEWEQYKPDPVD
jgi:hypothetical protein